MKLDKKQVILYNENSTVRSILTEHKCIELFNNLYQDICLVRALIWDDFHLCQCKINVFSSEIVGRGIGNFLMSTFMIELLTQIPYEI